MEVEIGHRSGAAGRGLPSNLLNHDLMSACRGLPQNRYNTLSFLVEAVLSSQAPSSFVTPCSGRLALHLTCHYLPCMCDVHVRCAAQSNHALCTHELVHIVLCSLGCWMHSKWGLRRKLLISLVRRRLAFALLAKLALDFALSLWAIVPKIVVEMAAVRWRSPFHVNVMFHNVFRSHGIVAVYTDEQLSSRDTYVSTNFVRILIESSWFLLFLLGPCLRAPGQQGPGVPWWAMPVVFVWFLLMRWLD